MLKPICSWWIVVVLVLVQGCSQPKDAEEVPSISAKEQLEHPMEGPIVTRNQDLDIIMKMLQSESGLTFTLDPEISIKVTFSLENPTIREILDTVLPVNGLAYCITKTDTVRIGKREVLEREGVEILSPAVLPSDQPVDLSQLEGLKKTINGPVQAQGQSIQMILQLLQTESHIQFVLEEGIADKVSLNLDNPTVGEVLEAILKETGLECHVQDNGVVTIRRKTTP